MRPPSLVSLPPVLPLPPPCLICPELFPPNQQRAMLLPFGPFLIRTLSLPGLLVVANLIAVHTVPLCRPCPLQSLTFMQPMSLTLL